MRTFEKDYRYLLLNLVPHRRLSPEVRREVDAALSAGDPRAIREASVLALEELCGLDYFRRSDARIENGSVVATYVRTRGFFQVRIQVPRDQWVGLAGNPVPETSAETSLAPAPATPVSTGPSSAMPAPAGSPSAAPAPVETTIEILPQILRALSINDHPESSRQRLESLLGFLPSWLAFRSGRLILVDDEAENGETRGEFVVTRRRATVTKNIAYERCRQTGQPELLDPAGARALGIATPLFCDSKITNPNDYIVGIAPVVSMGEFRGILEIWKEKDDVDEPLPKRIRIAADLVEQMIENSIRFENLISVDKLTRIYNRRFYDEQIRIEIERATRTGTKLSLLVMDLDDFKRINDTYGHQKGDEALTVVADLVKANLRKIDLPFRYGGEEFVILLPGTSDVEAIHTAERLRLVVDEHEKFKDSHGNVIPLSVSIGAAVFPNHARAKDELFAKADAALLRAKSTGKNRVEFHTS